MHAFSSDMTQANGSTMLSSLETAASEARTFKQVISNFRTETTTNLVGQGFNAVRDKMGLYQDALEKLATIADTFKANLVAANNAGLNAMQGYAELNTDDVYELTERLHQANAILRILESLVPVYEYSSTSGCYVPTGEYRTVGSAGCWLVAESLLQTFFERKTVRLPERPYTLGLRAVWRVAECDRRVTGTSSFLL